MVATLTWRLAQPSVENVTGRMVIASLFSFILDDLFFVWMRYFLAICFICPQCIRMNIQPLAHNIHCANGVTLSVQASSSHYCAPRVDGLYWYQHKTVEVGFIEKDGRKYPAPPSWLSFAEENGRMSDVFAYVPTSYVKRFVAANGGDVMGLDA